MWRQLLIGLLAAGGQAFFSPGNKVVWGNSPTKRLILAPRASTYMGATTEKDFVQHQNLVVRDVSLGTAENEITSFTVNSDKTITLDATGGCVEASGKANGDAVYVTRCTGKANQLWNILRNKDRQNVNILRMRGGRTQRIQLAGTPKCLDVNLDGGDDGGLRESPVRLRECDRESTDAWKFEEKLLDPGQGTPKRASFLSSARHVLLSYAALTVFGAWSLIDVLRWWENKIRENAARRNRVPLTMNQPLAASQESPDTVPASMILSTGESEESRIERMGRWLSGAKLEEVQTTEGYLVKPTRYRSSNFFRNFSYFFQSTTLNRIRKPVLANICWAALVAVGHYQFGLFQTTFEYVHKLVGSALGLLLVLQTNSAYARYWEGCKLWEGLLNHSRVLARLLVLYRKELGPDRLKRVANLMCAFVIVLAKHLGQNVTIDHHDLLAHEDLEKMEKSSNAPVWLTNALCKELKSVRDESFDGQVLFAARERLEMIGHVDKMARCVGACERLVFDPVPLSYPHHTGRCLIFWTLSLPLGLVSQVKFFIVPIMGALSWALFGIQEIGLMIENPFSDQKNMRNKTCDLDQLVTTICRDVQATVRMPEQEDWKEVCEKW